MISCRLHWRKTKHSKVSKLLKSVRVELDNGVELIQHSSKTKGYLPYIPHIITLLIINSLNKEQLKCMLNLQCDVTNTTSNDMDDMNTSEPWKIIIYDEYCRQIIAPLFSVKELQSFGITLYLLINKKRQKIPNVPAIYLIQPTQVNLDMISRDMQSILYDSFYLNFSVKLQRTNLEYLAQKLIKTNSYNRLTKMYDQYINYTSLSPNLFTLNLTNCYERLNSPASSDQSIQGIVNDIVQSLFCVIATLQSIPIIRAQSGGAAQQIGQLLADKISTHLKDRNSNLFASSGGSIYQNRPS